MYQANFIMVKIKRKTQQNKTKQTQMHNKQSKLKIKQVKTNTKHKPHTYRIERGLS